MTDLKEQMKQVGINSAAELAQCTGKHRNTATMWINGQLAVPHLVKIFLETLKELAEIRDSIKDELWLTRKDITDLLARLERHEARLRLGIGKPKEKDSD